MKKIWESIFGQLNRKAGMIWQWSIDRGRSEAGEGHVTSQVIVLVNIEGVGSC